MTLPLTTTRWVVAVLPVLTLLALVTSGKVKARTAALIVAGLTAVLAAAVFAAGAIVLGVAVAKGLWLGTWILAVVWPAMLLYRIADNAGFERIGALFASLFPNRRENLLILGWLLPSFVQGVAGFGTPIAVAAPLLLASGWRRERAVAYPLVGYHWSVTFGSMGSSFYMAALTSHLGAGETHVFARHAAMLLGINCLVAGALVLLLDGGISGLRDGLRLLLAAGIPMAATLYVIAPVVPAIATVAAGAVGFTAAFVVTAWDRLRGRQPTDGVSEPALATAPSSRGDGPGTPRIGTTLLSRAEREAAWLVTPYLYLLGIALAALLVPASRAWISSHVVIGPDLPATTTGLGWHNAAVTTYTPLEVFGHPGTYILLACLLGYLTYRKLGLWRPVGVAKLGKAWLTSVRSTSISIVGLACATTILIDAGMVSTLARGAVHVTGRAFPLLSGLVGALGSFLTGSTTSSNALFAALQAQVSHLLHVPAPVLLAAQTAGANVGNSLSPVVVLIGLSAVGAQHELAKVLRPVAVAAAVLLVVVTADTAVFTLLS